MGAAATKETGTTTWPNGADCAAVCADRATRRFPRVHQDVLTGSEARYIRETALPRLRPSMVIGADTPQTSVRSSETAHISRVDPVVNAILRRLCVPIERCEALQVLRYKPGGFYRPHFDSCCDDSEACTLFRGAAGQRTTTIILGLNSGYTGGGTSFPNLGQVYRTPYLGALEFTPSCDAENQHGGEPVITGEKWIANIWVRERAIPP